MIFTLDRQSPVPLYHQLKEYIVERVKSGEFPVGQPIPTEMDLVNRYNVSRATVRRAMQELEQDGYINRMAGKGTFVLRDAVRRELSRLTSFSEDMQGRGQTMSVQILAFRRELPPPHVKDCLGCLPDETLLYISRLRVSDGKPIALNLSYVKLPPGIEVSEGELSQTVSLWSLLEIKGISIIEADKTIEAIEADDECARLLEMPPGAPILLVEGVVYSLNHKPVEYSLVYSCGNRYKYFIHQNR